jgi:regulator of ribonuclease activity A
MDFKTADLCDAHADTLQIAEPMLSDFGGRGSFSGPIETVKTFEDNSLVRETLETAGEGRVLVVDGGGSLRCALLGDNLAKLGIDNGWGGVVINGCIRDSGEIAGMDIGVKALGTHPLKSNKSKFGQVGTPVSFAGVTFRPGDYLYADEDGIVVSAKKLD